MIELPRAAIMSEEIAKHADFFSFGTNDLTQTCLGFSRDDVESAFMPLYLERKIVKTNPFATLDKGVAELVRMGVEGGRKGNPNLTIGVCGETGGDPESTCTTTLVLTMSPAHHTACQSHVLLQHRLRFRLTVVHRRLLPSRFSSRHTATNSRGRLRSPSFAR